MLKTYDTSSVLSIISTKESRPAVADFPKSKANDLVVNFINDVSQVECFDLGEDLFLFGFNQDPYDVTHEAYWRTVFRS